jgi:glycosyltransferase involved in cell wall biosynthesis
MSLSFVLPAYNEEANLETAVGSAVEVASSLVPDFEVIVVDDGSTDGSATLLRRLQAKHDPHLRVLTHWTNQGYGGALRSGLTAATGSLVFFTDSDNQFDVRELKDFVALIDRVDMVTGFRVSRQDPLARRIVAWCYNRLVGLLFRLRVRDVNCAFKLMRREVIDQMALECDDSFISAELVARARKGNFRIAQRGVRHYPRPAGATTVRASFVPRTLRTIWRMWWRIHLPSRARLDQSASLEQQRRARLAELTKDS